MENQSNAFSSLTKEENKNVNQAIESLNEKAKKQRSKNAICIFFAFGLLLFLLTDEKIFSFMGMSFFVAGLFLVSLMSIPSYLLVGFLASKLKRETQFKIGKYFWLMDAIYDVSMTFILFKLFARFF